jgi:hypothetical protein
MNLAVLCDCSHITVLGDFFISMELLTMGKPELSPLRILIVFIVFQAEG